MFVTYSPDDGDVQQWEFAASEVTASQAEEVERAYGEPWDQFLVAVFSGGIRARRVLLWHLMRAEHPTLLYADTPDFKVGELECEFDKTELQQLRDKAAQDKSLPAAVLAHIDAELATAPEGTAGKAQLNRSERRTASRSRGSSGSGSKPKR
ncbi:hypothetical protein [Lentzea sp. NPDC059081]|uniref:hypothetical protein n=1 Tax=Lentzea sp. NPDC059081 TaxID=3346719 RepID=UPI0036BAE3C9